MKRGIKANDVQTLEIVLKEYVTVHIDDRNSIRVSSVEIKRPIGPTPELN